MGESRRDCNFVRGHYCISREGVASQDSLRVYRRYLCRASLLVHVSLHVLASRFRAYSSPSNVDLVRHAIQDGASQNFFWDHFLKELRHQAQLGNQAFWWHIANSSLTSLDWLKCDWRGTGKGTFLLLAREKTNGKLSINLCSCNFRGKYYYLISLRSVQIRIFCLWLKYAFFVNSKLYLRSNGTEGNFKPRKYLLLNSVLQALLSVTFFRRTR